MSLFSLPPIMSYRQDKMHARPRKSMIEEELEEQRDAFSRERTNLLEAQRIAERTNFDVEMMRETGFCTWH